MSNYSEVRNIAYLEPKASFSEMAKDTFCEQLQIGACFSTPLKSIKQIVDYVSKNEDTLGVLPLENLLDGTIRESFDNLILCDNPNIRIISEIVIPIEYCLLSKTTEFYSITGLITTPKLLVKCNEFIQNEMPRCLNIIENPTMLDSANDLKNYNLTYATIGNKKMAEECYLNILKEDIGDEKNNYTRYVLIGDIETEPTKNSKTTIAFRLSHSPGALLKILKIFLEYGLNMSYISSRPSRYERGEYTFFVNLDGHIKNTNILNAINDIKPITSYFKYLGSYSSKSMFKS